MQTSWCAGLADGGAGVRGARVVTVLCLGGGLSQADHLVDDVGVHAAGDDRDRLRIARCGLRVGAGEVTVLAEPGADPGVLKLQGAGQLPQLRQGGCG
jgi:hypothetical protein